MKILAAQYVLPISSAPIENGAVVIDDQRIVSVGRLIEIRERFPAAALTNFGEAAIIPGFVNCHSHLELSIMRGFLDDVEHDFFKWLLKIAVTRDQKLSPADIELSARLGAVEGARSGVTCFGDIGRYGRAGLEALKGVGLRGVVFQETEFSPFNENAAVDFGKLKDKYLQLRESETGLVRAGISPHAPYTVSRSLFELITDYALGDDIKLSVHAAESLLEESLMLSNTGAMADFYRERDVAWTAPGRTSVTYLAEIGVLAARPLLAHCILVDETEIELIAESGSAVAHCPKSNAKFGHRIAPLEIFLDRNLRIGLGSDSVASNNVCDLLEEGRFAVLTARARTEKRRLVSAREIVEAMTIGGARALRLEDDIGSLEDGKQADLTVLSLKDIAQMPVHDIYAAVLFASSARDVELTMVAGAEVFSAGEVVTSDETELKARVREISRRMREV